MYALSSRTRFAFFIARASTCINFTLSPISTSSKRVAAPSKCSYVRATRDSAGSSG